MTKIRLIIFATTIVVISVVGYFVSLLARGYRLNWQNFRFDPNGILTVKSEPAGAQIFIDGDLKGASDSNFNLAPGVYDLELKKNGFLSWSKRITIEKEVVTSTEISLFRSTPALTPTTFSGVAQPMTSRDLSKIAFQDKTGLWVMEIGSLPLGFNRDPKRIIDGDLTDASWQFSPDARQVLLQTATGVFLLDSANFTAQSQRVNVASQKTSLLASWEKEINNKLEAQIKNLPDELADILRRKASNFTFSPDESKVLYTASASADLAENLIPPLPGSSTQKQNRNIIIDHTYVYDIKEDRNFLLDENGNNPSRKIFWLLNSKNLVLAEENQITIMDYDATNRQVVYSGSFVAPLAFPYINSSKILILTNLGSTQTPNLYSLSLK